MLGEYRQSKIYGLGSHGVIASLLPHQYVPLISGLKPDPIIVSLGDPVLLTLAASSAELRSLRNNKVSIAIILSFCWWTNAYV